MDFYITRSRHMDEILTGLIFGSIRRLNVAHAHNPPLHLRFSDL